MKFATASVFQLLVNYSGSNFFTFPFDFFTYLFCGIKKKPYLCTRNAQMAEVVDALVSNTNGAIRAGSIPALGTENIIQECCTSIVCSTLVFISYG